MGTTRFDETTFEEYRQKDIYKTLPVNLLFICSRNKWRSPTAEAIFKGHNFYHAKSAGVAESARIRVSENMIRWADMIFVMEHKHKKRIRELFESALTNKEVIVLDIEDDYHFMDPDLIDQLKESLRPYLMQL
jgi:predicted protein tyrosine phosphatase